MKLLEVKNNLTKIQYEDTDNLVLGGFLVIADDKMPYVSQIMSLKNEQEGNIAVTKLMFTYDSEGIVKNYNGSVPSLESEISILYSKELLDILPVNIPIKIGQLAQQPFNMVVDKEIFENNFLICSDNMENTNILLDNFVKQFEMNEIKSIIFDLDGQFDFPNKIKFVDDFKLPLNYDTINYIYENDLSDIDPISKAIIQDIFIEVQEYTKTIPNNFIPFETFMDIVDSQYRETKMSQLILLKNKLLKYKEAGTFAQTEKEALSLENVIEYARNIVIDLSMVKTEALQQQIIESAYAICNSKEIPVYSFVKLDNFYANKPLLKLLTVNNFVKTSIITCYEFKYIKELKTLAKNMILFVPLAEEHDFASYNTFLNKLNQDEFILFGDLTQHIPFILQIETLDFTEIEGDEDITEELDNTSEPTGKTGGNTISEPEFTSIEPSEAEEVVEEELKEEDDDEPTDISEPEISVEEPLLEMDDDVISEPIQSDTTIINEDSSLDINGIDEPQIEEIKPDLDNIDEISIDEVELPTTHEEELLVAAEDVEVPKEKDEDGESTMNLDDTLDFLSSENTETILENNDFENFDNIDIDENELDLIEETAKLQNDIQEEVLDEEPDDTPIIPIYPASELDETVIEEFSPGEQVSHPKYGKGVVEKIINYGTKKLCSVMFSNNRRRLLDPTISELSKV